jgi:mannose-6-phosphate isomerase-like protein (cupin superfamily)
MNEIVVNPTMQTVAQRGEGTQDIIFVLAGVGDIITGSDRESITRGDRVFVPAEQLYYLVNTGDESLHILQIGIETSDISER